jgi:hypothetical protein
MDSLGSPRSGPGAPRAGSPAARLRDSGLVAGSLDRLRALALTDLTQGRDPLDRITPGRVAAGRAG